MMLLAALVTLEVRHVLDQAHNGDIQVVRQVDRLANDHGNKLLRCGNGDDTVNGQHLEHREEHIGGSRRHVDQHVVDVAPVGLVPELLDDAGNDRAAPCDGHVALREHEVHGHDLDAAVGERRVDARLVSMQLVGHAERLRDGGASDVRVQDADVETLPDTTPITCFTLLAALVVYLESAVRSPQPSTPQLPHECEHSCSSAIRLLSFSSSKPKAAPPGATTVTSHMVSQQ